MKPFCLLLALCAVLLMPCRADQKALALLNKVHDAADAARTLSADFTYITSTPGLSDAAPVARVDTGKVRLMKPNFADITFNDGTPDAQHIVSDGTTVWTYRPATNRYTTVPADPQGRNINVWRLLTIGGFFSVYTWVRDGAYVGDLSELTYAGRDTANGEELQVLEHKMTGTVGGHDSGFDQKIWVASDNLIHRFTMDFTANGKTGAEQAELTHVQLGQPMTAQSFAFVPPPGATEQEGGVAVDPKTHDVLQNVEAATLAVRSMTADFSYSEDSAKNQQTTLGTVRLLRPNFARVTVTSSPKPNFPNLVASDGANTYIFVPRSYSNDHNGSFSNLPYDPVLGAAAASGLAAGYGTFTVRPANADASNVRLWDALPFFAFFDPLRAIGQDMFAGDPDTLKYEGEQTVEGTVYRVLRLDTAGGNIAGGEQTPFVKRIFIGPDNLIHSYRLEFVSHGKPGVQTFTLSNIRLNPPLAPSDFQFSPPPAAH